MIVKIVISRYCLCDTVVRNHCSSRVITLRQQEAGLLPPSYHTTGQTIPDHGGS
ncbi:MAG: hypothetical protein J7K65_04055 [Planctomycetes bacterium]|nr:hypothetical protein [Planctomycetota bacterium]